MKKNWFYKKISNLAYIDKYEKPKYSGVLKLDSNENFVVEKQYQNKLISEAKNKCDVREYPEEKKTVQLIKSLSKYHSISQNEIGLGCGTDQIIDLLLSNLTFKKIKILAPSPTFRFFEIRCKLHSLKTLKIQFSSSMTLDIDKFILKSKSVDMIYLDSPNNPTGFQFTKNELIRIMQEFDGLIIVDEAYSDFSEYSILGMIKKNKNLIVLKTFSKAFGFAGLRLGYMISNKNIVNTFTQTIQYPYPVNSIAIEAGILLLENTNKIFDVIKNIKNERNKMIENLRKFNVFEVFDSKANFVLFDAKDNYLNIYTALAEQGILVKKLGKIGRYNGCLRVTIGSNEMNSKFLLAIRDLLR